MLNLVYVFRLIYKKQVWRSASSHGCFQIYVSPISAIHCLPTPPPIFSSVSWTKHQNKLINFAEKESRRDRDYKKFSFLAFSRRSLFRPLAPQERGKSRRNGVTSFLNLELNMIGKSRDARIRRIACSLENRISTGKPYRLSRGKRYIEFVAITSRR